MRIDAPIFTGSFSLNGSTLGSLTSVATTGSNTFLGGQSATSFAGDQLTANDRAYLKRIDGIAGTTIEVIAPISASAGITGSTNFDTIVNKPTLVSGSSQVIDILSSLNSATASFTPRISNLESKSSSVDISISNINSVTASNIARLSNLETKSASVDISITNINSFTASNANTSLNLKTGSYATTGSNTFYGTQVFSGSVFIATDLIVQGSSSIQYISASSVSIGTNIVNLNTANPAVRYAGISVQDSGSATGVTGSMLWDSTCNRWIYSNPSGVGYSGGIIMSGPRAATFGQETTLTCNYVAKSGGGDHLYDSCIIDDGTTICVKGNFVGTGTACFASDLILAATNGNIYGGTAAGSSIISNIGGQTYARFYGATHATTPNVTAFVNAGSTSLTISACGNVGIGSSSPAELLEVSGSLKIGNLKIQNSDGGRIGFNRNTSTGAIYNCCYSAFQINGAYANSNYLDFQNYNSSGSYIGGFVLNNGNVGICTSSPATLLANTSTRPANADGLSIHLYGLDWAVNGQGYAATIWNTSATTTNYNAGLLVRICSTDVTDRILDLESGGVNRFRMLGTGAATFNGNVTVTNNNWLNFTDSAATARNILTLASNNNLYLQYRAGCNFYLRDTDGNLRLTIDSSGLTTFACSVGIGSSPTAQGLTIYQGGGDKRIMLELNRPNSAGLQSAIQFTVGGSIMVGQIQHEYAASNQNHMSFSLRNSGGSTIVPLWLQNSGNVGIGTCNPNSTLDVNGCINSSYGIITSNGVITKSVAGTMQGVTATYFDFPTYDDAGTGQMLEIKAFFDHYYNWNYGAHYYVYLTSRDSNTQALTMFSCGTGNGGSWMAYKTSSTNLRVCKVAGSYGGGGAYWIQVTGKQP